MDVPIEFHPEAAAEAAAAMAWYGERSRKAAAAFLAELDVACERVAGAPNRYPARVPSDLADPIQVIAVAHGRRRPGYWRIRSR